MWLAEAVIEQTDDQSVADLTAAAKEKKIWQIDWTKKRNESRHRWCRCGCWIEDLMLKNAQ